MKKLINLGIALLVVMLMFNGYSYFTAKDVIGVRMLYIGDQDINAGYFMEAHYFETEKGATDYYPRHGIAYTFLLKKNIGSVHGVFDSLGNSNLMKSFSTLINLDLDPGTRLIVLSQLLGTIT